MDRFDLERAVADKLEFEKSLTEYTELLRANSDEDMVYAFAELRGMPIEAVKEAGVFYIKNMAEMLIPKYIDRLVDFGVISPTNNKPIFEGRWVFPIKNVDGNVSNLVGYLNGVEQRYIYGTAKYYRRGDTLWGLENLNYAYEVGWCIETEGITDALRYRSLGYKNAFAHCGTGESAYIMKQISRCRYGSIRVPDRDAAGEKTKSRWISNRYVTLSTPMKYKDSDELCFINKDATEEERKFNQDWLCSYIDMCANWLKTAEHHGYKCECKETTMI